MTTAVDKRPAAAGLVGVAAAGPELKDRQQPCEN
jgi:hypothetical protein